MADKKSLKNQWSINARNRRKEIVSRGGRWLSLLLEPDAAEALAEMCQATGLSAVRVISDLLISAKRRLRK